MSIWGQVVERLVVGVAARRFSPCPGPHLSVRWRKPFALGTAPSKLFRVPKRPVIPEDEAQELKRLHTNYKTYMKSFRAWLATEKEAQEAAAQKAIEGDSGEEAEHQRCLQINQKWNEQVAKEREVRLAKEREATMERILNELEQHELQKESRAAEIRLQIETEKELSAEYITEANIDDAIEQALSTEVDYNYAIDRDGNYIRGFKSKQPVEPKS